MDHCTIPRAVKIASLVTVCTHALSLTFEIKESYVEDAHELHQIIDTDGEDDKNTDTFEVSLIRITY